MPFNRWSPNSARLSAALLLPLAPLAGSAQPVVAGACSSDGQPAPRVLVERFLPDDCAPCWARPTRPADLSAFTVDWVVPGAASDAPLAAAALPEAAQRLASIGYTPDTAEPQFWKWRHPVSANAVAGRLRVAHGPAVNDYVGVSIGFTPSHADNRQLDAWLLLVEELPAGTEGSPSPRRLVRAAFSSPHASPDAQGWTERRSMRIPEGADPSRLRVVGWLADSRGRVLASAASRCPR